jgi:hypothetical protein
MPPLISKKSYSSDVRRVKNGLRISAAAGNGQRFEQESANKKRVDTPLLYAMLLNVQ